MNKKLTPLTMLAALMLVGNAFADEDQSLMDYVAESCAKELTEYCSTVTPGEGRLVHCIAAHEDKLSAQCEVALFQAAVIIDELVNGMVDVAVACEGPLLERCGDVELGEGRVLMCLKENSDATSDACDAAVDYLLGDE
jgi:hypothetical protein